MQMRSLKLGVAGMRGVIGSGLTPARIIDFASAFGTFLNGGQVIVAWDTRISSDMVSHAVISTLLSCGCQVYNAGVVPAPQLQFMVPDMKADGALLLGAGHQGAGWNAIIPIASNGAYFNNIQIQELLDIYHSRRYRVMNWNEIGKVHPVPADAGDRYLDALCSKIDVAAIRNAGFTVVADFCNGTGSVIAEKFASRLGIKMIAINNVLSGILPHEPEPRPRSSFQVQSIMTPLNADCGLVFNTDMSRLAVVTDTRETLSEEYTFPLIADYVLAKNPGPHTVVTNLCSTRTLDDIVAKYGGELEKTKVGQANMIDKMTETGAILAGEGSGSVAVKGWVNGFDSFMAAALLLESMAVRKMTLSALTAALPRYFIVKKIINCPSTHAYTVIRSLKKNFPDAAINEDDGLRFDWEDGWISLRAAATEPVIRMIAEYKNSETAVDRALYIRGLIERLVAS